MLNLRLINILRDEMVPALGCTEPIAIAYAASIVSKTLGHMPERLQAECSANIVKNVKSVIVPNSGGMKGIDAAAIVGAYAGNSDKRLEVLSDVTAEQVDVCKDLLDKSICEVTLLDSPTVLHIILTGHYQSDVVSVEIKDSHTNVVNIIKNGQVIFSQNTAAIGDEVDEEQDDKFSIEDIIHFSRYGDYSPLIDILDLEIRCNSSIAQEGLENDYGISVGQTILMTNDNNVRNRARALAASGSDARMSGCDMPVVINSGSGNQGLTVSLPVIEYAKELNASQEQLHRALILSNLVAIYEKSYIGKLSAYCGVVCAASGSAAGITMLKEGTDEQIQYAVINTLGTLSGMICDGAKPSCASKIATCIDTAISCHEMAMRNRVLNDGEGIIKSNLDSTVKMVGRLASQGMRKTDSEILSIMLDNSGV
ncbi:L-cysteine desulfidase family protein [Pragia fontium]|uniref:UPF0597 protein SAMN02745723_10572 n=1 Tax=Pragia fontium DSM 5563 = ATCC 49100 TaxID=1122977 RepID=A0AAJ4WAS0_9GAMM|nr:L-serine ammonia-lyase, iron-sulfur-dependent, subunit alpha [Pragia fontium]SFC87759.1 L-cysteine desulfidase [Pragia fontium DSM 5563 = ATCC 49100]SUB83166.1 Serine dehydratase alpha chain [Pragia fontium]VEJ56060.1 Serine dehydratase alpha chain [Pragia fontium]